jgi:ribosome production factor 2
MLIDFFNGEVMDAVCLPGIEHVISISLSPSSPTLNPTGVTATTLTNPVTSADAEMETDAPSTSTPKPKLTTRNDTSLPKIHIRGYTIKLLASGSRVPRVELVPMGPSLDLYMRRHTDPDPVLWKEALRRPKVTKKDVESGLGKKRKNLEVDEMGDLRGRIHVGKQNLDKLQTRKMKGLKDGETRGAKKRKVKEDSDVDMSDGGSDGDSE